MLGELESSTALWTTSEFQFIQKHHFTLPRCRLFQFDASVIVSINNTPGTRLVAVNVKIFKNNSFRIRWVLLKIQFISGLVGENKFDIYYKGRYNNFWDHISNFIVSIHSVY